uniref:Uncharacterized protein AlNc14C631G12292 n=1 Tax=Albugo laibachii Nc14 TaxID=890382 RepID=F0X1J1_9STRA|nr:conserved hypothetical protein [Albugo laibachii Nc14]|eukprot:CCA27679.1 conserved hypothetical protein [Albugo laibachii Nc14]
MDVHLQDADSRVNRLLTDFDAILDAQDMDGLARDEPAESVQILVQALKRIAFSKTVQSQLKKSIHRTFQNSVPAFVVWLTEHLGPFFMFEAHIQEMHVKPAVGRKEYEKSVRPPSLWPNQVVRNTSLKIREKKQRSVLNVAQKSIGFHSLLTQVKKK